MKLSPQDTSNILNIITTCSVGGIDSVVIDEGVVRGINGERNYVILSDVNVPKLPQKLGLSRLAALRQRIELFNGNATVIEARESDRGEISSLDISSGRSKAQFRCTATMLIKAPKSINDPDLYKIYIHRDEMKLILNAIKVMGGNNVQLVIKKDRSVTFSLADSTNDAFTAQLETLAEVTGDEQDSAVFYYLADIFHSVMKTDLNNDVLTLSVGMQGTIKYTVNGHNVAVIQKINEDSEDQS